MAKKTAKKSAAKKTAAKKKIGPKTPAVRKRVKKAAAKPRPAALAITLLKVGDQLLKAGRGHHFKRTATGIALMKGRAVQANFTCECSNAGGCRVEIDGQTATCLENGCSGSCGWVVNVPGIAGVHGLAVLRG